MPQDENISLHLQVIAASKRLPVGSDKRIVLFNRSILGILRALRPDYNPHHFEGKEA